MTLAGCELDREQFRFQHHGDSRDPHSLRRDDGRGPGGGRVGDWTPRSEPSGSISSDGIPRSAATCRSNDALLPALRVPQGGLYRLAGREGSSPGRRYVPPLRSRGRRRRAALRSVLGEPFAREVRSRTPDRDLRAARPEPIRGLARAGRTSSTPPPRGASGPGHETTAGPERRARSNSRFRRRVCTS